MSIPRAWLRGATLLAITTGAALWLWRHDVDRRPSTPSRAAEPPAAGVDVTVVDPTHAPDGATPPNEPRVGASTPAVVSAVMTAPVRQDAADVVTETATATGTAMGGTSSADLDLAHDPVLSMQAQYSVDEARLLALIQRQTGAPPSAALKALIRSHQAGADVSDLRRQAAEISLSLPARVAVGRWLDGLERRGQTPERPSP